MKNKVLIEIYCHTAKVIKGNYVLLDDKWSKKIGFIELHFIYVAFYDFKNSFSFSLPKYFILQLWINVSRIYQQIAVKRKSDKINIYIISKKTNFEENTVTTRTNNCLIERFKYVIFGEF